MKKLSRKSRVGIIILTVLLSLVAGAWALWQAINYYLFWDMSISDNIRKEYPSARLGRERLISIQSPLTTSIISAAPSTGGFDAEQACYYAINEDNYMLCQYPVPILPIIRSYMQFPWSIENALMISIIKTAIFLSLIMMLQDILSC